MQTITPPDDQAKILQTALGRTRQVLGQAAQAITVQVDGEEHVPVQGAAIVACNHAAPLDRLRFTLAGRRVRFLTGTQIARAAELLDRGELVGIFPEGRRSPDGRLYRGEPVLARIVAETGAMVLPVASVAEGGILGRTVGPRLRVGAPVDLERFLPATDDLARQCITDAVMTALMDLSGQVYMDLDVTSRRAQLGDERRSHREATRAQVRARKAEEQARAQQRIADRQAEAAELARIQAQAAAAAHDHARRAAEADALRCRVRATSIPPGDGRAQRAPGDPLLHDQL